MRRGDQASMLASELGHWDVPDACAVFLKAWEFVERGARYG